MTAGPRIGFVGTGNMGAPMVRCLAKAGFPTLVCDGRLAASAVAQRLAAGLGLKAAELALVNGLLKKALEWLRSSADHTAFYGYVDRLQS